MEIDAIRSSDSHTKTNATPPRCTHGILVYIIYILYCCPGRIGDISDLNIISAGVDHVLNSLLLACYWTTYGEVLGN